MQNLGPEPVVMSCKLAGVGNTRLGQQVKVQAGWAGAPKFHSMLPMPLDYVSKYFRRPHLLKNVLEIFCTLGDPGIQLPGSPLKCLPLPPLYGGDLGRGVRAGVRWLLANRVPAHFPCLFHFEGNDLGFH